MKILQYPHVILSTKTCGLLPEAAPVLAMLPAMEATMRAANGIGLAANQVGIQYRFAIIDIPKDQWTELNSAVEMPLVLINPEIIKREGKVKEVEGCLSIRYGKVPG
jgi:peptide deformylase